MCVFSTGPLTDAPTKSLMTNAPTKSHVTNAPTKSPLTDAPTKSPSTCPGTLSVDYCLNLCIKCPTEDGVNGFVYVHQTGNGCALHCISCELTCGIKNALDKEGKAKPTPGCEGWEACRNKHVYESYCV